MKIFLWFFLSWAASLAFADSTPSSSSPPPTTPTTTPASSASAQVTLSQSSAQLDETKILFHHSEYKYLDHKKNRQKHLTFGTQDGDGDAN